MIDSPLEKRTKAAYWLTFMVRVIGILTICAFFAIVAPHSWMVSIHEFLGFEGELPDLPIIGYLTRSLSAFYVFFGYLFLYLGRDVVYYRELIRMLSVVGVGFGIVLTAICVVVGTPVWWTVVEGVYLIGFFGTTLILSRQVIREESGG